MMMNIFSNFDPMWFNICYNSSVIIIMLLALSMMNFWYSPNSVMAMTMPMNLYMMKQLKKTKLTRMKSLSLIMMSTLTMIMYMNILGLLPYLFSMSSHIIVTLSLGLPLWMLLILSSMKTSTKKTMSHLLPDSTPLWLSPFLIMVESISMLVRPLTLSFRLAANMTAGHIILSLISATLKTKMFIPLMLSSTIYMMFELMICIIQAYIFCLLISMYSNDHP